MPLVEIGRRPVGAVGIELSDDCGHRLRGVTDADGNFSFSWKPVGCTTAVLTVWSATIRTPLNQGAGVGYWIHGAVPDSGKLTGATEDYLPHAEYFSFSLQGADLKTHPNGLNVGPQVILAAAPSAKAFNLLHHTLEARRYFTQMDGMNSARLPRIGVAYARCTAAQDPSLATAFYAAKKNPGFIWIPGPKCRQGDFGWYSQAVAHEMSHYFQFQFLRQTPEYGRFGEGMANAQSAAIMGSKWVTSRPATDQVHYVDLQVESLDYASRATCRKGSQLSAVDTESQATGCANGGGVLTFPQPAAWSKAQDHDPGTNQGWVGRIAWDLIDGAGAEPLHTFSPCVVSPDPCDVGQFDSFSGGGADNRRDPPTALAINDVLIWYLGGQRAQGLNPHYVDRGLDGIDVVDLLDGMVCRGHMTTAQVGSIMTAMGMSYSGSGAPKICPHPNG
jgi:hypothetical protein